MVGPPSNLGKDFVEQAKYEIKSLGFRMKFLLIGEDIGYGGPVSPMELAATLENVYIPSFEILEKWESDRKITGGFFAAQRAGAMIIEAPTGEELSKWMTSLPFWGLLTWKVIPLQSFHSGIDDAKTQVGRLKSFSSMKR
jgi:hypothetical protein